MKIVFNSILYWKYNRALEKSIVLLYFNYWINLKCIKEWLLLNYMSCMNHVWSFFLCCLDHWVHFTCAYHFFSCQEPSLDSCLRACSCSCISLFVNNNMALIWSNSKQITYQSHHQPAIMSYPSNLDINSLWFHLPKLTLIYVSVCYLFTNIIVIIN